MGESSERVIETLYNEDGSITFRRSDGSIIWKGTQSESGYRSLMFLFVYNYNSNNNPSPSKGQVRSNGDSVDDTTQIMVNRIDGENRDVKRLFLQTEKDQKFYVQDINDSDSYVFFTLMENGVDNGDFVSFNVEYDHGSAVLLDGTGILIGLFI